MSRSYSVNYRPTESGLPTRILSPDQAGQYLGLPVAAVRSLSSRGFLKPIRYPAVTTAGLRRGLWFDLRDLDAFIDECRRRDDPPVTP